MAVEIPTVRRVYLNAKLSHLRHSAYHTAIAPAPAQPENATAQALVTLTFQRGIAEYVPLTTFEIFRDLGIATTERPRAAWEDESER